MLKGVVKIKMILPVNQLELPSFFLILNSVVYRNIIHTETLAVMCVLECIRAMCVCFQKTQGSQHLEFTFGHRIKAQNYICVCLCVLMVVCEYMNIFQSTTIDSDKGLLAAFSLTLGPHAHTDPHSYTFRHLLAMM